MSPAAAHCSPYAGSWYPDDPEELRTLLTRLFAESERRTGRFLAPEPLGLVVPHAGLIYSGTVAASAYRHLRAAAPERVIIIGFSHRGGPPGCWVPDVACYRTPLGEAVVDREAGAVLLGSGSFRPASEELLCDHSVEIQLPLLAAATPQAKVVPVYVSHLDPEHRAAAGRALAEIVRSGAVLVASSDFTHFGRAFGYMPFAADAMAAGRLRTLDESSTEAASSLRPELFVNAIRSSRATVCGVEPIALLLAAMAELQTPSGEVFQETLDYQTSGDITGDWSHCVSYAALGYFPFRSFELAPEDGHSLLNCVRRTLTRYLETGERKAVYPETITTGMERRATAFVTLQTEGRLRGCVGRRAGGRPLAEIVPELALSSALDDSRFAPLTAGEGPLETEISILSPLKLVRGAEDFRVNEHGAVLEAGYHHGLLLPQVGTERKWTTKQFLEALARKAGTTASVYADPAMKLSVFRAQIISEEGGKVGR